MNASDASSKVERIVKGVLGSALLFVTLGGGYISWRTKTINRLYSEGANYPGSLGNDAQSAEAVRKLAGYRGERVTAMLLNIAMAQSPLVLESARSQAIKALAERKDPKIALALTNFIQPYQGLNNRQAAATALQRLPCSRECVLAILHYLERIWYGEPNYEDWTLDAPGHEDLRQFVPKSQQELYDNLYVVLQREKPITLAILMHVYGLGTTSPSKFALVVITHLGTSSEGCQLLKQSESEIGRLPSDHYWGPLGELNDAISLLNCK
jgi:hypothetical protein